MAVAPEHDPTGALGSRGTMKSTRETPMRSVRVLSSEVSLLPARVVGAVLDAPRAARDHPTSRDLRHLLADGFRVVGYDQCYDPVTTQVVLERGDDTRELASPDLAFAAYAAQMVPRAVARAIRDDRSPPRRTAAPSPGGATVPLGRIAQRAQVSPWISGHPGLAADVAAWEQGLGPEHGVRAARLARPGAVPPLRAARHVAALQAAQVRWALLQLPGDVAGGLRPVRDPGPWLKQSVAQVMRDQLSLLGPAAAEVARIIEESEGIAPATVVDELRRRPVRTAPLPLRTVERVVHGALGEAVRRIVAGPLSVTPVSQLHMAELADGTLAFVRARRPGVSRALRADARITATLVAPFEWLLPAMREAHPLGFVELAARQLLEEVDLRNDALNAVELGMVAEDLGCEGVVLCRPFPGLVSARAMASEAIEGAVPLDQGTTRVDVDAAMAGLVAVTAESALVAGVFHADLRPEHLLVLPDGRLAITGCGTVGRFDPATRRAALDYLAAVLGGDVEGQVAAMRAAGAVPDGADLDGLTAELASAAALQPMAMLGGGEASLLMGLREAMVILLRYRLRPPVEVVLFVRTLFTLRSLLAIVAPERGLLEALFPLIQRLPELRADAEC